MKITNLAELLQALGAKKDFKAETIIDTINEYWQIELAELEV